MGILNRKKISFRKGKKKEKKTPINMVTEAESLLQMITDDKDRRQHTSMVIEPIRGDYGPFDNLSEYSPPD